jgi:Domain of unknown function (DUF4062)
MQSVIPVFIASPNDVCEEREFAVEAVRSVSSKIATIYGIVLTPITWEEFAPISSGESTNPQFNILKRIQSHSIFIGILYKRYGTKIPEMGDISGTESEFNHALDHKENIQILTYFRKIDPSNIDDNQAIEQLSNLNNLKKRLRDDKKVLHASYSDVQEFRRRIVLDLFEAVLKMIKSPTDLRLNHYEKFFQFTSYYTEKNNPLLIVYPPISDPMSGHSDRQTNWKKYLLPTVVFEDTKTIQNLEATMNLIGKNYQTVMDRSVELRTSAPGDRLWICISRNMDAQNSLKLLGDRPRFSFLDGEIGEERKLKWRLEDGQNIIINSPLSKYLTFSKRPEGVPKWEPIYGHTYTRDYAILARFCILPDKDYEPDKHFFYYYLGGIRGLGTWGASWFIKKFSSQLAKTIDIENSNFREDDKIPDIQILLEVTYLNYKIVEVRDVSSKSHDFFTEKDCSEYIKKQYENAQTFF